LGREQINRQPLAREKATRVLFEAVESSDGAEAGWHNKADDERLPLQRHPNLTPRRRKQEGAERARHGEQTVRRRRSGGQDKESAAVKARRATVQVVEG
jgi:hypothetical protein